MSQEQVDRILSLLGRSNDPRFVDRTLGKVLGVRRMIGMYQSAAKLSDHRLRALARRQFHSVQCEFVVLEAEASEDLPEPSEEEIAAQFQKYRDIRPGEGERGFGYRLPDRVKLEWLMIPNDSIREMVQNSDEMDGVALIKHWKNNPNGKPFPEYERGTAIPDLVRNDLLNTLVARKREEIRKFASDALLESQRRLDTEDGYLKLPEDWDEQKVDYREMAQQLQVEFPGLPLPKYEAIGDRWLDDQDLRFIPIAMAWTEHYGKNNRLGPAQLVARARAFGGDPVVLVQEGVTMPPLRTTDNSIIFLRITDTDPARPPRDLAEVREQVVADLKKLADYDRLRSEVDSIRALLKEEGLLSVAIEYETPIQPENPVHIDNAFRVRYQLEQGLPLDPMPSNLPVIRAHMPTIETIVDRALQFPPGTKLRDIPAAERSLVIPVDEKMVVMVVEMLRQFPLDRERFDQLASNRLIQTLLLGEELDAAEGSVEEAFGFEALAERHNFKIRRRAAEEETDETTEETGAEETAAANVSG
jgi:hypothetical protein